MMLPTLRLAGMQQPLLQHVQGRSLLEQEKQQHQGLPVLVCSCHKALKQAEHAGPLQQTKCLTSVLLAKLLCRQFLYFIVIRP